jgi:hypothetical protein
VAKTGENQIALSIEMEPAGPLWKIAPTRDENGDHLSDFLMIIPRLRQKPEKHIKRTLNNIDRALKQFNQSVVFANMDMKLNTLWVSFKPEPGLFMEIAAAIKLQVPEAVLVGDMSSRIAR